MRSQPLYLMNFIKKKPKLIAIITTLLLIFSTFLTIHTHQTHHSQYVKRSISLPNLTKKPENHQSTASNPENLWKTVTTHSGDTLGRLFNNLGLTQQNLLQVTQNNPYSKILSNIKPNQTLRFLILDHKLEQLILSISPTEDLFTHQEGDHYISQLKKKNIISHNEYLTATVKSSLYETAKRQRLPYKLVQKMTDILNWEVDFSKDVRTGDQFSILYKAYYVGDQLVDVGDILALSYTNRGHKHQATRYLNADGEYDYFSPEGVSLRKAFTRYPIKFSYISSTFSLARMHPKLHYVRPHKGVDLAAPIGTPIYATGSGRIEKIGRQSDYGNMIKIAHNRTYSTIYGHMLKFQKGLSIGSLIKRGQIIGYVGQSGLATGPHCHYEFHVNHVPRNPATIDLPRSSSVAKHRMSDFKAQSTQLLAHLKLYEEGNLIALKDKKSNTG